MKEKVKTKTEKKKGITLKRLIIFVFILVMAIGLIIGVKWRILYNIQELNDSKKETKTIQKQQNNKEFSELIELFENTEQPKTDNEVYKECINELMGLFSGIRFDLNKLLIGENITLERWNEYDYASTLEKLIEINNRKHKIR